MREGVREGVLASEPVGRRSWATELPCFFVEIPIVLMECGASVEKL